MKILQDSHQDPQGSYWKSFKVFEDHVRFSTRVQQKRRSVILSTANCNSYIHLWRLKHDILENSCKEAKLQVPKAKFWHRSIRPVRWHWQHCNTTVPATLCTGIRKLIHYAVSITNLLNFLYLHRDCSTMIASLGFCLRAKSYAGNCNDNFNKCLACQIISIDYYMLRAWYRFCSRVFNIISWTSESSSEWALWY